MNKFKIGDTIKLTKLDNFHDKDTNLEIGDVGVVMDVGELVVNKQSRIYYIKFEKEVISRYRTNMTSEGYYIVWENQIELIEE